MTGWMGGCQGQSLDVAVSVGDASDSGSEFFLLRPWC